MEVSCGVELRPTQLRYVSLMLFFQPLYPKQIVRKKREPNRATPDYRRTFGNLGSLHLLTVRKCKKKRRKGRRGGPLVE